MAGDTETDVAATTDSAKEPAHPIMKAVGILSAVIGLFVTLNTFLTGCAQQGIENAKAHREAIRFEETYWSDLFQRFLNASSTRGENDGSQRAEMLSIAYLSQREQPSFSEYQRNDWFAHDISHEADHLGKLKDDLDEALRQFAADNPEVGQDILLYLDDRENAREREDAPPPEDSRRQRLAVPEVTQEAVIQTRQAQMAQTSLAPVLPTGTQGFALEPQLGSAVLSSGVKSGWDIDVFWCTGPDARRNYNIGARVSDELAQQAESSRPIARGLAVGRVRLRSLSESAQETGRYATGGDFVVYDSGKGEEQAARQLTRFANSRTDASLRTRGSRGQLTPYYLSVFICTGG